MDLKKKSSLTAQHILWRLLEGVKLIGQGVKLIVHRVRLPEHRVSLTGQG